MLDEPSTSEICDRPSNSPLSQGPTGQNAPLPSGPFPSEVCMCKFLTLLLAVTALAFGLYTALAQGQLPGGATAANFAVIRNGEQIGTSTVRVQHSGGETTV